VTINKATRAIRPTTTTTHSFSSAATAEQCWPPTTDVVLFQRMRIVVGVGNSEDRYPPGEEHPKCRPRTASRLRIPRTVQVGFCVPHAPFVIIYYMLKCRYIIYFFASFHDRQTRYYCYYYYYYCYTVIMLVG